MTTVLPPEKLQTEEPPRPEPPWRTGRSTQSKIEERRFYLFLTPWIIGFLVFAAGPLVGSIILSLTNYFLLSAPKFVGLQNYARLIADPLFYKTMLNTVYFGGASVALSVVFTLVIAILLNQQVKGLWFSRWSSTCPRWWQASPPRCSGRTSSTPTSG